MFFCTYNFLTSESRTLNFEAETKKFVHVRCRLFYYLDVCQDDIFYSFIELIWLIHTKIQSLIFWRFSVISQPIVTLNQLHSYWLARKIVLAEKNIIK
jgi:hypothetical protein